MQYREFPRIPGVKVSTLGFGFMRLPLLQGGKGIDEEATLAMARESIAQGVNYWDTAWPYHGGASEPVVGRALKELGCRDEVMIATKSPTWLINEEADWDRYLDLQLGRLGVDKIDFYLLHALNAERWDMVGRLKGLKFLERAKADGRIGHIGFSFHDGPESFIKILEGYDWEFCQIQYNYMDTGIQAGSAGLERARRLGVGVIAMEPLKGGALAGKAPEEVKRAFARHSAPRTGAEWALRWVLDHAGISCLLSGMGSMEQLLENAAVCSSARAGGMTAAEKAIVAEVKALYEARTRVPCTACGYCMPCPSGVAIPDTFGMYNELGIYGPAEAPKNWYRQAYLQAGKGADKCTECGACEPQCPQGIKIIGKLKDALAELTS